ncbi:TetR/AcrR family transcriptional regulator [Mycobacterium sp. MYCO198283]|uniref:TetR/AcrR family transcriptional regulator n=1 Tax=Mycobacterium sp. MYCO198283 TaxID=2883505 RepID=UPI001E4F1CBB|nr:TetR/AcrR family transcriptional regulator [Mycobacterium sp. MYCO198283]MCG5433327.1 TetR/AcrR family transcriptional regulator [Mycobacterium sp. MYCO198283]
MARTGRGRTAPGGQARTRLARAAVIDAAAALFLERGYAATTVEAISARSDVPQATVYRLFSSKHGILKAVVDVSIAGDDRPVSLPERPQVRNALADPDARRQVAAFVAVATEVNTRSAPMYRILVGAASADDEAAALLEDLNRQRRAGQGQLARSLARAGALRPGLRERDAVDVLYALMSPDVYRLLVHDRKWPPKRYQQWLGQTLVENLLDPATFGDVER